MISALCVLYVIDLLYQKNNPSREILEYSGWSQEYFDNDIVPACTAIFIHNLHPEYFKHSKITLRNSPIAFLLKLSDSLQDWERPSFENKRGFSADDYYIDVKDNKLLFTAPSNRKSKIKKEIKSTILVRDIEFL